MYKIFELFRDAIEEWRWNCKAHNGEIIADSGEGVVNRGDCQRTLMSLIAAVRSGKFIITRATNEREKQATALVGPAVSARARQQLVRDGYSVRPLK